MKIYYPAYYKSFKCIADKCSHSCCVGWEIGVDAETARRYETLGGELGDDIRSHICDGSIALCDDGRCPFLEKSGLCRIISSLGDEYTSLICREHPRFYHRVGDRIECGIGLCCEEACRIILSSDAYDEFYEAEHNCQIADETDFDTLAHREHIYSILADERMSYGEKKTKIITEYALSDISFTDDSFNEAFSELEYLDEAHHKIIKVGASNINDGQGAVLERMLAYLVFRHVSVAEGADNLRARVGFCLLLCSVMENLLSDTDSAFAAICEWARIISEEIEYSEDNTAALVFEIESRI
ncbi:MAG: flagellin lysine-N-methylase [Clostridia bacterium]|nr:flagellin lysine-N-methylase [Clostridia bacterium]